MSRKVKLFELAHARAGDKGTITNICLFPYDEKIYPLLEQQVTAEKVKELFSELVAGEVIRYDIPSLKGFNFVLQGTRSGGVSSALAIDAHGKSLSYGLLELEIDVED
ncbi:MAG: hypothetical protein JXC33_07160 [Deltaproteobacteria bacterium]|nr:hypothetical protein [Deltaproteobacteria bacterium]